MLTGLTSSPNSNSHSSVTVLWRINLVLSTREPEVVIPLTEEAVFQGMRLRHPSVPGAQKTKIQLVVDVFSQKPKPDLACHGGSGDVKVGLHRHIGRVGEDFFGSLLKEGGVDAYYVCGPGELVGGCCGCACEARCG